MTNSTEKLTKIFASLSDSRNLKIFKEISRNYQGLRLNQISQAMHTSYKDTLYSLRSLYQAKLIYYDKKDGDMIYHQTDSTTELLTTYLFDYGLEQQKYGLKNVAEPIPV